MTRNMGAIDRAIRIQSTVGINPWVCFFFLLGVICVFLVSTTRTQQKQTDQQ